ncbi:MAG: PaaI family thioesterase [Angustibacter sp.]
MTDTFADSDLLARLLGVEILQLSGDSARITWTVSPQLLQPAGVLHGGIHSWITESITSLAAGRWFADRGRVVGVNNNCDFVRAVGSGEMTTTATPIHRGRSQQLWSTETLDEQGRLVARGQVRLQNLWADPAALHP